MYCVASASRAPKRGIARRRGAPCRYRSRVSSRSALIGRIAPQEKHDATPKPGQVAHRAVPAHSAVRRVRGPLLAPHPRSGLRRRRKTRRTALRDLRRAPQRGRRGPAPEPGPAEPAGGRFDPAPHGGDPRRDNCPRGPTQRSSRRLEPVSTTGSEWFASTSAAQSHARGDCSGPFTEGFFPCTVLRRYTCP